MIHSIILDDNVVERARLKRFIHQCSPNFDIFDTSNIKDCIDYLKSNKVNVLFLDIELVNESSFELVNQLKGLDSPLIVYVSHHPKYTKQCIGYKVIKFIEKKEVEDVLPQVLEEIESYFEDQLKVFSYQSKSLKNKISYSKIVSFVRDGDYVEVTYLHRNQYKKDYIDTSIKRLEESLDSCFIKISQSVILNVDYIKEMNKNAMITIDDQIYTISRSLRNDVISKYHQTMMRKKIIY